MRALSLVSIGITLAFVIPRVPAFAINGSSPLVSASGWFNDSIPAEFSRSPANFSFAGAISLQVDTTGNFLPLVFNDLDAQVYDLSSSRQVGVGHMNHTKLPAKTFTDILMPLNFTYLATNDSDLTCKAKAPLRFYYYLLIKWPISGRDHLVQRLQKSGSICEWNSARSVLS